MPDPRLFFLRWRQSIIALFATLAAASFFMLSRMPLEFLPPLRTPQRMVTIQTGGMDRISSRKLIAEPLYRELSSALGVKEVRTIIRDDQIQMLINCRWSVNPEFMENELRGILDRLYREFPPETPSAQVISPGSEGVPLIILALKGDRRYQTDLLLPTLNRIEGVGRIEPVGLPEEVLLIEPDELKMRKAGLTPIALSRELAALSRVAPHARLEEAGFSRSLLLKNRPKTLSELRRYPVGPGRQPLQHFAEISCSRAPEESFFLRNGRTVSVLILYGNGDSPVSTAGRVRREVERLNIRYSGELSLEVIEDNSILLSEAVNSMLIAFAMGLCAAFLILRLFTGCSRTALLTALMIPVCFLITLFLLGLRGKGVNLITLSGLTVSCGMIIDNNLIVLDQIQFGQEINAKSMRTASFAVIGSTASTLIIFLPLFLIQGLSGLLFRDLAWTVASTLCCSIFSALILIPALLSYPRIANSLKPTDRFKPVAGCYGRFLRKRLSRRSAPVVLMILLNLCGLSVVPMLQGNLVRPSRPGDLTLEFCFPGNDSIEQMRSQTVKIVQKIGSLPGSGCEKVQWRAKGGRTLIDHGFEPTLNRTSVRVTISPLSEKQKRQMITHLQTTEMSRFLAGAYTPPGIIESTLGSSNRPDRFRYKKPDSESHPAYLQHEKIRLLPRPGVFRSTGITPAELLPPIALMLGTSRGKIPIEGKNLPIMFQPDKNLNLKSLMRSSVGIGADRYRLDRLCHSEIDVQRPLLFLINNKEVWVEAPTNSQSDQGEPLYPSELKAQSNSILVTTLFALIFLYGFLAMLFNCWSKALLSLALLPLSVPPALFMLFICGGDFNLNAVIALLILAGSGVNSSILLLEGSQSSEEITGRCRARLRPVVMTTLTTIVALLPFLRLNSMAPVLCGGLIASTLNSLILLPLILKRASTQ